MRKPDAQAPRAQAPLIVIFTDFGLADPFVGVMKGVIASIAPEARIIDLTHEIPPGDVLYGAVVLWQSRAYFSPGTIFLGVVDPGVGTERRPVVVESKGQIFIGPDNGLFSFSVGEDYQAWELRNSNLSLADSGKTFHGRDIFAPAASYIAVGIPSSEFGPSLSTLTRLPTPLLKLTAPGTLQGEVLHADRFGNLLTSLGRFIPVEQGSFNLDPWIPDFGIGIVRERSEMLYKADDYRLDLSEGDSLDWVTTFAEAPANGCAFLVGSSGLLEIVANRVSAAQLLGMQRGDQVTLRSQGDA